MNSINTIEGLLFRSYLYGYNLSFLHKCISANCSDLNTPESRKAAFASCDFDFEKKINWARQKTETALNLLPKKGIHIIAHFQKAYPQLLRINKSFPPLLYVQGKLPAHNNAAIVGSRETSPLAKQKVDSIAAILKEQNLGIVSGLALGIDTLAHEAALKNNLYTAAILPYSYRIYPSSNEELAASILESGGALISEMPPNCSSVVNPFVLRNRIQAALSQFVIPVEMARDSGTRYTLQYAAQYQKKIILCMPGITEIDHHLKHYEGIILAAKKFAKNQYVFRVKDVTALKKLIATQTESHMF